jgi:hypothetical protein
MGRTSIGAVAAVVAMTATPVAAAAQTTALATAVKAAYLSKFAAYVTWPPAATPTPDSPIKICVVGRDPFQSLLDEAVASQQVDQHPLVVRRLATVNADDGCHIAFLGGSTQQSVAAALNALQSTPVLTVTDERTASARGIMHLAVNRKRVGFHVNTALAARNSLAISSKLLGLALSVTQKGQP